MAEDNTPSEGTDTNQTPESDQSNSQPQKDQSNSQSQEDQPQKDGGNNESDTQKPQDNSQKGEGNNEGNNDSKPQEGKNENENDATPPVRKTKLDYIRERRERRKAKDEAKSDDASAEISAEEEERIAQIIEKRYGGVLKNAERITELSSDNEINEAVNDFLDTEEGKYFKDHKAKIIEWAKHENRATVPIAAIAMEIVGPKKMLEIGAQMAREIDRKAAESQSGGGGGRKDESGEGKDYKKMSSTDFQKELNSVLSNGRI